MQSVILRKQIKMSTPKIVIPLGDGKIVHAAEDPLDHRRLDIWFEVPLLKANAKAPEMVQIRVVSTSEAFPMDYTHIFTVITSAHSAVHILRKRDLRRV